MTLPQIIAKNFEINFFVIFCICQLAKRAKSQFLALGGICQNHHFRIFYKYAQDIGVLGAKSGLKKSIFPGKPRFNVDFLENLRKFFGKKFSGALGRPKVTSDYWTVPLPYP